MAGRWGAWEGIVGAEDTGSSDGSDRRGSSIREHIGLFRGELDVVCRDYRLWRAKD